MSSNPFRPLQLGKLVVELPVFLAPMAGYTDSAMRALCARQGCCMSFTEVANSEALIRHSRQTMHLFETDPEERLTGAHIYGRHPETMAGAARLARELGRFQSVDINAGCPVRKIVAKGAGAALMGDPARLEAIVKAVCAAVDMPVTVKTRIGLRPDALNILDVSAAVENGGAAALFLHARAASNLHKGEADWAMLAAVKQKRRIPIIGNGGVKTAADAAAMMTQTGVDGVMVGRGAVGNPWFFKEVCCLAAGTEFVPPSDAERRCMIEEHLNRLIALKILERRYRRRAGLPPEQSASLHFRAHLIRYLVGYRNCRSVIQRLETIKTPEGILQAVDEVLGAGRNS